MKCLLCSSVLQNCSISRPGKSYVCSWEDSQSPGGHANLRGWEVSRILDPAAFDSPASEIQAPCKRKQDPFPSHWKHKESLNLFTTGHQQLPLEEVLSGGQRMRLEDHTCW